MFWKLASRISCSNRSWIQCRTFVKEFHREEGLIYRILTEDHEDEAISVLTEAFRHEPIRVALGFSEHDLLVTVPDLVRGMAHNGLSLACIEEKTGHLVGCLMNEDVAQFLENETHETYALATEDNETRLKHDVLFTMLKQTFNTLEIFNKYDLMQNFPARHWLHVWMGGTRCDFQGRGILRTLIHYSKDVAAQAGFERGAFASTTGSYSTKALARCGFECAASFPYATFTFAGGPSKHPLASVSPHHPSLNLMVHHRDRWWEKA
eukprot:Rmarinus@m.10994